MHLQLPFWSFTQCSLFPVIICLHLQRLLRRSRSNDRYPGLLHLQLFTYLWYNKVIQLSWIDCDKFAPCSQRDFPTTIFCAEGGSTAKLWSTPTPHSPPIVYSRTRTLIICKVTSPADLWHSEQAFQRYVPFPGYWSTLDCAEDWFCSFCVWCNI